MAALQRFLFEELPRRGWTIADFARRAGISTSNGYLIVRDGFDNVRQDTFDGIAAALGMSPVELSTALGKGNPEQDPDEARVVALFRLVAPEKRSAAADMLAGLAVQSTSRRGKSRVDGAGKRLVERRRELLTGNDPSIENEPRRRKGLVTQTSGPHIRRLVAGALAMFGLDRDFRQSAAPA